MELNEEIIGKFINDMEGPTKICNYYEITKVTPKMVYTKNKKGEEIKFKKTDLIEKIESQTFIIDSIKNNPFYKLLKKHQRG